MIETLLQRYNLDASNCMVQPFGSGLINTTWKILHNNNAYILQKINDKVFKQPWHIAANIQLIKEYLQRHNEDYLFVAPVVTKDGKPMVQLNEGYFRMFNYVPNSHTIDVVATVDQAYEAAKQFGAFTKRLSRMQTNAIQETIAGFHDLNHRYQQFEDAVTNGNKKRIQQTAPVIEFIKDNYFIVDAFKRLQTSNSFKKRVTHHDTKISNVLFNDIDKGLCVIDLDTVMPGYFISDVGDMMRTYLSPVSEEEKDTGKIEIRDDYFKAIATGYLSEMADELTDDELDHFVYAGMFMIYMQAVRFLADHLNDDVYYAITYPEQNYVRTINQVMLLQQLMKKEQTFKKLVNELVKR